MSAFWRCHPSSWTVTWLCKTWLLHTVILGVFLVVHEIFHPSKPYESSPKMVVGYFPRNKSTDISNSSGSQITVQPWKIPLMIFSCYIRLTSRWLLAITEEFRCIDVSGVALCVTFLGIFQSSPPFLGLKNWMFFFGFCQGCFRPKSFTCSFFPLQNRWCHGSTVEEITLSLLHLEADLAKQAKPDETFWEVTF